MRRSKLNLVDLAGSERVTKSQLDGHVLKEAKYINLSLHYLEQVIIALQASRHTPSCGSHRAFKPQRGIQMCEKQGMTHSIDAFPLLSNLFMTLHSRKLDLSNLRADIRVFKGVVCKQVNLECLESTGCSR